MAYSDEEIIGLNQFTQVFNENNQANLNQVAADKMYFDKNYNCIKNECTLPFETKTSVELINDLKPPITEVCCNELSSLYEKSNLQNELIKVGDSPSGTVKLSFLPENLRVNKIIKLNNSFEENASNENCSSIKLKFLHEAISENEAAIENKVINEDSSNCSKRKSFTCQLCKFEFHHSRNLKDHILNRHFGNTNMRGVHSFNSLKYTHVYIQKGRLTKHVLICSQSPACDNSNIAPKLMPLHNDITLIIEQLRAEETNNRLECEQSQNDHLNELNPHVRLTPLPESIQPGDLTRITEFDIKPIKHDKYSQLKYTVTNELPKKYGCSSTDQGDQNRWCRVCGRNIKKLSNLKGHMLVHNTDKLFTCRLCDLQVKYKNSLKQHILTKHTKKTFRKHQQTYNLNSSNSQENLLLNELLEKNDFVDSANVCQQNIKEFHSLNNHTLAHNEDHFYVCLMCSSEFKDVISLKAHIWEKHMEEKPIPLRNVKPFRCMTCKNKFQQKGSLMKHTLTCKKSVVENPVCFKAAGVDDAQAVEEIPSMGDEPVRERSTLNEPCETTTTNSVGGSNTTYTLDDLI